MLPISEEVRIQNSASLLTLAIWQSPKTYCPFWGVRVLCFSTVPIIWGWESPKHHLIIKEGEWLLFWAQTNVTNSYIPIFMLPNSIKDGDWNSPISSQISSKKKKTRTEHFFASFLYQNFGKVPMQAFFYWVAYFARLVHTLTTSEISLLIFFRDKNVVYWLTYMNACVLGVKRWKLDLPSNWKKSNFSR